MKLKFCLVTLSVHFAEWFLLDQIAATAREYDLSVYVHVGKNDPEFLAKRGIQATVVPTTIERKIRPWQDLRGFWQLWTAMRRERFAIVHSTGPKAGLIAMCAAWLARVPVRIHTFTGQVWYTSRGPGRWLLKTADRMISYFATHVLVDSPSQHRFIVGEGVVSALQSSVLAQGSISGVNVSRFRPDSARRADFRKHVGIPDDVVVILYMARLTRDKGALDMAKAFVALDRMRPGTAHLIIVGPDEESLIPSIRDTCRECLDRVHFFDATPVPELFMAAADVLCLPSHREGFGSVLIDAAATGIPAVASRIYGSEDAVVDGVTGLLHEVGNPQDAAEKLCVLLDDPVLRAKLGEAGRARAVSEFSEERLTCALLATYRACLAERALDRSVMS